MTLELRLSDTPHQAHSNVHVCHLTSVMIHRQTQTVIIHIYRGLSDEEKFGKGESKIKSCPVPLLLSQLRHSECFCFFSCFKASCSWTLRLQNSELIKMFVCFFSFCSHLNMDSIRFLCFLSHVCRVTGRRSQWEVGSSLNWSPLVCRHSHARTSWSLCLTDWNCVGLVCWCWSPEKPWPPQLTFADWIIFHSPPHAFCLKSSSSSSCSIRIAADVNFTTKS